MCGPLSVIPSEVDEPRCDIAYRATGSFGFAQDDKASEERRTLPAAAGVVAISVKTEPWPPAAIAALRGKFVSVAGRYVRSEVEIETDPDRVDHLWITVKAGQAGRVRIDLNTFSLKNRLAGLDPRMFVAVVGAAWNTLPEAGLRGSTGFDYAEFETASPLDYGAHDRLAMESMLTTKAERSIFIEAWGELYIRGHLGLHQLHSRRANHVVKNEVTGRDGAIRFYFEQGSSETLLFKFHGQA